MNSITKQISIGVTIYILLISGVTSSAAKLPCPESFKVFWGDFRKSIEKDRMKDIRFLSQFPVQLASADGGSQKDLGPKEFQNLFYKLLAEKCDVMDSKNQKEWILNSKVLPEKSSFFTCTQKWAQFCNFEFNLANEKWHLTKISTTQKELIQALKN